MTDSATLTGGFAETGTIAFTLFAPGVVLPIDSESVNVTGNGTYTTPTGYTLPTTGTVTGTYQWVASYSGDPNNNPVASARGMNRSWSLRPICSSARRLPPVT